MWAIKHSVMQLPCRFLVSSKALCTVAVMSTTSASSSMHGKCALITFPPDVVESFSCYAIETASTHEVKGA